MEPERTSPQALPAPSRRDVHGATRRSRREERAAGGSARARRGSLLTSRWVPRTAVLAALATATIGVPVHDHLTPDAPVGPTVSAVTAAGLPSAYDVLSSTSVQSTPTNLLAAMPGTRLATDTVSRSLDRDPLPGCDGQARTDAANGQIPASDLCTLWDPAHALRGDAAVALSELNFNYRAVYGRDLCLTDSYRPLAVQRRLAYTKPGLAATPGRSNHGWGLAIDLCSSETNNSGVMSWLRANGPTYGWDNPQWARRGGSGPYEPWHWEYAPGTTSLGTNWDQR